jgi:hypothetical protein
VPQPELLRNPHAHHQLRRCHILSLGLPISYVS